MLMKKLSFVPILFIYFSVSSALAIGPYSDNGKTIYDQSTGLTWQQNTGDINNDGVITPSGDKVTWSQALTYCEGLILSGKNDWRMPNIRELLSIVDYTRKDPSINPVFQCEWNSDEWYKNDYYWSSTSAYTLPDEESCCTNSHKAWSIWFRPGDTLWNFKDGVYDGYVRCVRGVLEYTVPISTGTIPTTGPYYTPTPFGTLSSTGTGQFNEDQDLFVISHGWNNTDPAVTSLPLWEVAMAIDIKNKTGVSGGNVLKWNWQEKAVSDHDGNTYLPLMIDNVGLPQRVFGVPFHNVKESGKNLAIAIKQYLHTQGAVNYTGSIHMIGHSLGSGVVLNAALDLKESNFAVKQLTLLDSPWYVTYPAKNIKSKLPDVFIDNYWTMLGRPQGYKFADVNVWIDNRYAAWFLAYPVTNKNQLSDGHQLAHLWYRSSITNFQDTSIIALDDTTPTSTKEYGFYWHDHQSNVPENMFHITGEPYWKLRRGIVSTTGEFITDTASVITEITQKTLDALIDFAETTAININILAAQTMNEVGDTVDYVTDTAGHAFWAYNTALANGYLKLILNSEAFASVPVNIPAEATSMQLKYEFLSGCDPQTQFEVYLNDKLIFVASAEDIDGVGEQVSGWIDIFDFAGQQANLTYRLSNPVDGPLGEIAIDDVIFAKLTSLNVQMKTGFPWSMFLPAINAGK